MGLPADLMARLSAARVDRGRRMTQINDFIRYADPTKPRIGDTPDGATDRSYEADDLFDTTLQEVAEDFASDLIARVMPRSTDWIKYVPQDNIDQGVAAAIKDALAARSAAIFAAIRASNFYDETATEWAMDQGHGTSAIISSDPGAAKPFCFQSIPPSQLLMERAHDGTTGFRAREYSMAAEEALAHWPDANWNRTFRTKAKASASRRERVRVIECAERILDPGDEKWLWRVAVDDNVIVEDTLTGIGSCPIIVSRWRTHSTSAWGIGPLLKAVPDGKTLDQERYLILKNLGKIVDPPVAYDDDGVTNPEAGVGPGMWIPRQPGSKVDVLPVEGSLSAAYYEQGQLEDKIRRAGFQDGPRQRGKTPPTLGQWADEKAETGRRLEMPTGKLYAEGVIAIVQRVEYMLEKRGAIQAGVMAKGHAGLIKVRPLNPLSKQQDMQDVQVATNLLQQGNAIWGPQVMGAFIDGPATFLKIKDKLNDELVVVRTSQAAAPLLNGALHVNQPAADGGQPPTPTPGGQQ